ncbi:TPA: hypothetical protein ACIAJP_000443 [Staphylococcus aureus]
MDLNKFEELYKGYKDDDVIEQFAIYVVTDEEKIMKITDKKLTSEDKQVFQKIATSSYRFNVVKEMYDYYLYDFQIIKDYIKISILRIYLSLLVRKNLRNGKIIYQIFMTIIFLIDYVIK